MLSVIAVFAISAGILLAAQSGCIGATLAGTDGSYDTPDTGLSEHAPVQAVTAWEGMTNLSVACQIADTFADMLFTGVLDAAYAVHAVLSLTAVGNIADTPSLVLDGASDITTFVSGGHTYAAVAAYLSDGVQILDVTDPSNITAASSIRDVGESTPDLELRGAQGITTFESGGHTYAAVAAYLSDGVQILDITDPSNITPAGHITDDGTNTDSLELEGASGITTFVSGSHTYAAVTASDDNGVQILDVTDPLRIAPASHITDDGTNTDSLELWAARGITIFESGVHTYAAVTAYEDDGVQILNVTDPSNITAAGSITDTDTLELDGASGITTFVSGGHTYAAVAAFEDDGVQILDITDPLHITPAGSIDTNTLKLYGAQDITTFTSGDHTYVAVAAYRDNGVQILDVTDPLHITAAGNIADIGNNDDDLELNRAQGITTFTSGDHIYAAVAAYEDDGVQIIRIDIPPDTTLPADAFVTTWKTTSADESITLPLVGTDITINWGDGNTTAGVSTPVDHTYNTAGDYTVQITGGLTWFHLNNAADASKLVSLDQWGTASWASMENAFSGASNMVYNAGDAPDLSGVTDMSNMFDSAYAFNGDLSSWDVSSVTEMDGMFEFATSFNHPLNDWDVSSVTDMGEMFAVATSFNQPLNDWDVSSVTYMSGMFYYASSFNQPLNDWDVSSVASMSNMFHYASVFNHPLNDWDVSSVTNMNDMFQNASSFNQPLNDWDVSSVTYMSSMFYYASDFNHPLNDWDVSRVINMDDMFYFATAFSQNLGEWYVVANATSIARADVPGVVAEISAQNDYLNDHNPTYGISRDNDYAFFEIVNGNKINMASVGTKSSYMVNVTASGSNVFEDGNNWRMLEVSVSAATLSDNADLGSLTISSGTLSPQFSSSDITYTASVDNSVTQVTVTPTASDSLATIAVNDNIVPSGTGHIVTGLNVGTNTVTVIVTAQDSTTKTYIITLTRAASLSGNADLGSLTISSGTLSPQFSSSDITYTASVDNSVTQVTVTPTASDSLATIAVNDNIVPSGTGHIVTGLNVGTNTVTVIVTAQDSTTKTYIITLTRAASLSGNADLGGLTISSGTLSPQFSSSDITYTASVDNSVTQVTVTPTASDSLATIAVNDNIVPSGTGHIVTGLNVGTNTVTVIVTAQDSTTKTYIITLTRAASLSGNADLGGLTISSGTLSPQFSSSDITYTASVDNSVTQVTVTPTASDSLATIAVNDNIVPSGTGHIVTGLTVGEPTTVTVIVTAQDSTTKTYIITLTRAASLSDNANLGGLTISSGTLSPQFSSSDITYTASVDNSVTQVTVTPTASDSLATIAVNDNTVTSGTGYILTGLTVDEPTTVTVIVTAQDSTTKTYTITVTVRDVPITVSSAAYNPGNGQLTITFNQDIATVDYSGLHVRSSANPDTGGITLSSVTGADYSGRTITATLDSEQQDQYDALQSPHLVVEDGAVTDTDGDRTTDVPPQPIRDASQKGSSSSSKAPIVHINALAQSRLVDIPPHIAEQVESHDASDPLEPITPDGTFDLPLVINGYGYLLDAYENTLIPQTVTAGDNPVHITFTVYTEKEFAHFILYLNLQGRNTNYADSDTYITYKDDGTTSITDPHGYIGSATVTVTQEDDSIPEKRTVRITIEFGEEPMGPTNMVAYMWNTDRKALFVKIIDALEVVAASPESAMQAADPEPLEPDSVLPADPEPVTPDFADDAADPEPVPYDILGPDDYDDTQILQIIRMWSGFESESITDEQLLELLGLDDHQGADIPDWMMTELGVLVAKGTVTVDEFMLALQYVLEHD